MDQLFIEREKELFKLNAKLNAKTKKIQTNPILKVPAKTVQIHTANNYFNFYEEPGPTKNDSIQESLELRCKKITITNPPVKKPQEIVYPLFNHRHTTKLLVTRDDIHIHLPTGTFVSDGKEEIEIDEKSIDIKSEVTVSLRDESLLTRCSDDSSAVRPADRIPNLSMPLPPPLNDIIPKSLEKKSNDGLMKFLKAKVVLLQTELEAGKSQSENLEKENSRFLKKIKKLSTQNDKSSSRIDTLESSLKSLQDKNAANELALKDKEATISEVSKELTCLKEVLKETSHSNQVLERKVLKAQEDFEAIKSKYETFKDMEIIMRESSKDERIAYEEKIGKLRKGRMDLLKAYKQQIILIDNLRRQNVCLEKAKSMEIAEKEFLKVLDWNFSEK